LPPVGARGARGFSDDRASAIFEGAAPSILPAAGGGPVGPSTAPLALIVDDDAAVSKVIGGLLVQSGMAVEYAASGPAALGLLAVRPIDVVLTDLRMPGMDGMELLARIRAEWP
jgi:PleD family two-component response regulator